MVGYYMILFVHTWIMINLAKDGDRVMPFMPAILEQETAATIIPSLTL